MQTISTTQPIYNGLSIRTILSRMPTNITRTDRNEYIRNCVDVFEREQKQIDLTFAEQLRNRNFIITMFYNVINGRLKNI